MAYHTGNYIKRAGFIVSVYNLYNDGMTPDTEIVSIHFPKHNIFISYRQWMNIKGITIPRELISDGKIVTTYERLVDDFKAKSEKQLKFTFN